MRLHLNREQLAEWVDTTVDDIKKLLEKEGIPYEDSWTKNEAEFSYFYLHQLIFPWHQGDVVVGTLHASDDYVIHGQCQFTYPSIETYHFPWDEGDITVFDTPEDFVRQLKDLYFHE